MNTHELIKQLRNDGLGKNNIPTKEEIDIILGWFKGDLDIKDLVRLYGLQPTAVIYKVARSLRALIIDGDLVKLVDQREKS